MGLKAASWQVVLKQLPEDRYTPIRTLGLAILWTSIAIPLTAFSLSNWRADRERKLISLLGLCLLSGIPMTFIRDYALPARRFKLDDAVWYQESTAPISRIPVCGATPGQEGVKTVLVPVDLRALRQPLLSSRYGRSR
jgi:hypothetical protein